MSLEIVRAVGGAVLRARFAELARAALAAKGAGPGHRGKGYASPPHPRNRAGRLTEPTGMREFSVSFGRFRLDVGRSSDRPWAMWSVDGEILAFARWGSA